MADKEFEISDESLNELISDSLEFDVSDETLSEFINEALDPGVQLFNEKDSAESLQSDLSSGFQEQLFVNASGGGFFEDIGVAGALGVERPETSGSGSVASGAASGFGQLGADIATVGTGAAVGATVGGAIGGVTGLLGGPAAPATVPAGITAGAASGAAVGAKIGGLITFGSGIYDELSDTFKRTKEEGGSTGDALQASLFTVPTTIAGEFADRFRIGKLVNTKSRKAINTRGFNAAKEAAGEAVEDAGRAKILIKNGLIVGAAGAAGFLTENAQTSAQNAAVEVTTKGSKDFGERSERFLEEFGENFSSTESRTAGIVGAIVDTTGRVGTDLAASRASSPADVAAPPKPADLEDPKKVVAEGLAVIDDDPNSPDAELNALTKQLLEAVVEVQDPETSTLSTELPEGLTLEVVQEFIKNKDGIGVTRQENGRLSIVKDESTVAGPVISNEIEEDSFFGKVAGVILKNQNQAIQPKEDGFFGNVAGVNTENPSQPISQTSGDKPGISAAGLDSFEGAGFSETRQRLDESEGVLEDSTKDELRKRQAGAKVELSKEDRSEQARAIVDFNEVQELISGIGVDKSTFDQLPTDEKISVMGELFSRNKAELAKKGISKERREKLENNEATIAEFLSNESTTAARALQNIKFLYEDIGISPRAAIKVLIGVINKGKGETASPEIETERDSIRDDESEINVIKDEKAKTEETIAKLESDKFARPEKTTATPEGETGTGAETGRRSPEEVTLDQQAKDAELRNSLAELDRLNKRLQESQDIELGIRDEDDLEKRIESITNDLIDLDEKIAQAENEGDPQASKVVLDDLKKEKAKRTRELNTLETLPSNIERTKKAITKKEQQIQTLQESVEVEERNAELEDLRKERQELNKEIRKLKAKVIKLNNDPTGEIEANNIKQEIQVKQEELSNNQNAFESIRKENEQILAPLNDELRELKKQERSLIGRSKTLERQKDRAALLESKIIPDLEQEVENLGTKLQKNRDEFRAPEAELKAKKADLDRILKSLEGKESRLEARKLRLNKQLKAQNLKLQDSDLPKATIDRLTELAEKGAKFPINSLGRRDISNQMMIEVSKAGGIRPALLAESVFKGNLLGSGGLLVNVISAGFDGGTRNGLNFVTQPKLYNQFAKTYWRELFTAASLSKANAVRGLPKLLGGDGKIDPQSLEKLNAPNELTLLFNTPKGQKKLLKAWAFSARTMFQGLSSGDGFFKGRNREFGAILAAGEKVRKNRDFSKSFDQQLSEELNNSAEAFEEAYIQASEEFDGFEDESVSFSNRDKVIRAFEIIEEKRDPLIVEQAKDYSRRLTYTNEPEGAMAAAVKSVEDVTTYEMQKLGGLRPVSFLVPFVRTIGNVADSWLDYTAVGTVLKKKVGNRSKRNVPNFEKREKAMTALLSVAAAAMIFNAIDDEEEMSYVDIIGGLDNLNYREKKQSGVKPWSVKIGNLYLAFDETPLSFALAPMANYRDRRRTGEIEKSASNLDKLRIITATNTEAFLDTLNVVSDSTFFKSTAELLSKVFGQDNPFDRNRTAKEIAKDTEESLALKAADIAGSVILPKGLLKDISEVTGEIYTESNLDVWSKFVRGVPVVARYGTLPQLNWRGEEMGPEGLERARGLNRFVSYGSPADPATRLLAELDAFPARPNIRVPRDVGKKPDENKEGKIMRKNRITATIRNLEAIENGSFKKNKNGSVSFLNLTDRERYQIEKNAAINRGEFVDRVVRRVEKGFITKEEAKDEIGKGFNKIMAEAKVKFLEDEYGIKLEELGEKKIREIVNSQEPFLALEQF